ncbi:MAG: hypothetical protein D3923_12970, partial [Candidatus Electrothrix sp. AR3]|nr:hypothetical protein [Candidatus Electrothrix sp. AR3]
MKSAQHIFLGLCVLLLGGCSTKLPLTEEISGEKLKQAEKKLIHFLDQSCVNAVDSDIKLSWHAYGQQETYPAVLQAMGPASLRLALTDPLGRPLFLLASDGTTFTLADNSKSIGYTGSTELQFIRRFLPEFIPSEDLFHWLSGRIHKKNMLQVASTRSDMKEQLHWYEVSISQEANPIHLLALDKKNRLSRHMIVDKDNDDILFDARYSSYRETTGECGWPGKIDLSGKALEAEYSIEFTEIFNFSPIEEQR